MANPVGQDSWLAYLDESSRNSSDLDQRVNVVELYKRAILAEPGSLRIWIDYCNYFWSLWADSQSGHAGWTDEEQMMGRELFSFGAALDLWQQGYEAIKYRLNDSHVLWDKWISHELELLSRSRTLEGIRRVTHLYRGRLMTPHLTWDATAQSYSGFLSEYNRAGWEESMKDITLQSQKAKRLIAVRDPHELRLQQAARANDMEAQKTIMTEYLEWEMIQSEEETDRIEINTNLCCGLFDRALTELFIADETTWNEYVVFLSTSHTNTNAPEKLLGVIRRAVQHCPWSGLLWNKYILCAEEARLDFSEIESIKHAATSENQLYKNGMESMLEMYVAWCGFLKRTAMDPKASDEAVDVADVGLIAALEDVEVVGQRLYGKQFQGDPKFRLERIYIQYLTEKKGAIEDARAQWNKLASIQIYADNYDFWFRYYMWEMSIFSTVKLVNQSLTSPSTDVAPQTPTLATAVLHRAATRTTVDWPEKILEVYMQHCNDYELSTSLRRATGLVHRLGKVVRKRRVTEQREKAQAYAVYHDSQDARQQLANHKNNSHGAYKRKRELHSDSQNEDEAINKRQKSKPDVNQAISEFKRDRENTTIIVSNLPVEVTQTKLRQYFKEFGHINSIPAFVREQDDLSTTAIIEFSSPDEAQSALLRDGKFFGHNQIDVKSGLHLTVYVANYPPTADEKYIRGLFADCGKILSIRWPSLKVNTHRRFCYISFRDQAASARAVSKDGLALCRNYQLIAKYSDPGRKKDREGPLAEGREIRITGLNTAATEETIRDIFAKYGIVTRINIPQTSSGKGKGFAFVVFEAKEDAEKSVSELNNTKFLNQILHVEISKAIKVKPSAHSTSRASASPSQSAIDVDVGDYLNAPLEDCRSANPTSAEIAARTIALLGFPDTVNDARVRCLVEPFGTVIKMVLQPSHGGAKIEFADSAMAGKASLHLNNMDFEGRKLRIGSLEELRHAKAERLQDRIVYSAKSQGVQDTASRDSIRSFLPQPPVRRPVPSGLKRGMGFKSKREITPTTQGSMGKASSSNSEGKDQKNWVSSQKTNADFKMLLLTGSFTKPSKEQEKGMN